MKRPLKPEEIRIWGMVSSTIHPLAGRGTPTASQEAARTEIAARLAPPKPAVRPAKPREGLDAIEPNRRHRIAKEREDIGARLDLHGLDQARARTTLESFLTRAWNDGWRAVLVITGKGVQGDGVLKRRAPEWLAAPHLAHMVAGISDAARHHGGDGALYVALKRRPRS
jgi:DNA-nicking Smr family endonuclease